MRRVRRAPPPPGWQGPGEGQEGSATYSVIIGGVWVLITGDDLRSHPVGGAYERISPSNGPVQLSTHTKIHELHLCMLGQQHILALDVPVNHMMDVKVRQALHRRTGRNFRAFVALST